MKIAVAFLILMVAASHQQFYNRRAFPFPWMPTFARDQRIYQHYPLANHYNYDDFPSYRQDLIGPLIDDDEFDVDDQWHNGGTQNGNMDTIHARFKGLSPKKQKLDPRFFFGMASANSNLLSGTNPLIKTATLTITSTCTALSVVNCINPANVNGADAAIACARRRRDILPTQVQIIMPTMEASLNSLRQERQRPTEVLSSKSDNDETTVGKLSNIKRVKRFFGPLWQQFVTGLTVTTWNILSVTSTKTYVPSDNVGDPVILSCIPPGFIVCVP